ncbi:hypothetical protein ScPMuIL_006210 [Solemya velum]
MERQLKEVLNTSVLKCVKGNIKGGKISRACIYETDDGMVFVKSNNFTQAKEMFDGELRSLEVLYSAGIIRVPKPIKVVGLPDGGAVIAMEALNLTGDLKQYGAELGEQLARLHLLTVENGKREMRMCSSIHKSVTFELVDKFGFDVTTYCGFIPQDNSWQDDWVNFFARKIEVHMQLIDKEFGNREVRDLWSQLLLRLPKFFKSIDVKPTLLHGDLCRSNIGETEDGPVMFDPYCFYGHSEFDLSISKVFGGIPESFYDAYHTVLPVPRDMNND